jgi:hypothetical protein
MRGWKCSPLEFNKCDADRPRPRRRAARSPPPFPCGAEPAGSFPLPSPPKTFVGDGVSAEGGAIGIGIGIGIRAPQGSHSCGCCCCLRRARGVASGQGRCAVERARGGVGWGLPHLDCQGVWHLRVHVGAAGEEGGCYGTQALEEGFRGVSGAEGTRALRRSGPVYQPSPEDSPETQSGGQSGTQSGGHPLVHGAPKSQVPRNSPRGARGAAADRRDARHEAGQVRLGGLWAFGGEGGGGVGWPECRAGPRARAEPTAQHSKQAPSPGPGRGPPKPPKQALTARPGAYAGFESQGEYSAHSPL